MNLQNSLSWTKPWENFSANYMCIVRFPSQQKTTEQSKNTVITVTLSTSLLAEKWESLGKWSGHFASQDISMIASPRSLNLPSVAQKRRLLKLIILRGSTALRWASKQILFEQWFMVFIDLLIALTVQRVRKIHVKNVLRGRETDFGKFCCFVLFVLNVCVIQSFKKLCGKRYVVIIMQL